jgi:hypothetical protein
MTINLRNFLNNSSIICFYVFLLLFAGGFEAFEQVLVGVDLVLKVRHEVLVVDGDVLELVLEQANALLFAVDQLTRLVLFALDLLLDMLDSRLEFGVLEKINNLLST